VLNAEHPNTQTTGLSLSVSVVD